MTMYRWFWAACRTLTLVLFGGVVIAGYAAGHPILGWGALGALLALHASELRVSLRLPATAGMARSRTILLTLLFGFTWWIPVKRGSAAR